MAKGKGRREEEENMSDDDIYGLDETEDFSGFRKDKDVPLEEEVYGFDDSDDISDDEEGKESNDESDMQSDLEEGEENLPDDRAWGKSSRRFYNTDYVDKDFEGFYEGKEAEEAELEEQEAKQIQKRLIEQLNDADFDIAQPATVQTISENETYEEIKRDVSTMTERQKLDLLQKESPELFVLIEDFKNKLNELEGKIVPVINYLENKQKNSPGLSFLKKKFLIIINYCANISFYLLLKAKGISVQNHPVLKSLYKYRKLLEQISEIDTVIQPQVENILKELSSGVKQPVDKTLLRSIKKGESILKLFSKSQSNGNTEERSTEVTKGESIVPETIEMQPNERNAIKNGSSGNLTEDEKRAITYEMAKNKGLMPKRNKAQRNPRVKHRIQYRKALIRRRGQVRTPRSEIPVYGGESSGIKAGVTKSIKFK